MLVSPHYPPVAVPNYGDNIYVYTFNPANGVPPALAAEHGDVRMRSTDYSITIPKNHPSGLFWLHSHLHGISLNQISAGLSGTITVGNVGDYVCNHDRCSSFFATLPIRHMVIKDFQALADGTRKDEEEFRDVPVADDWRIGASSPGGLLRRARFFRVGRPQLHRGKVVRYGQRAAVPDRADDVAWRRNLALRQ